MSKLRANGIMVNYELAGQGDCLVLVHGAGDSLRMWYGQVPEFSRHYRVLTYDIRGFGETELGDADVDVSLLAADLRELLRALGIDRAFVLGHSMGGRIALQLAIEQPEMVQALVLSSSGIGVGARPPGADERRRQLIEALERGDLETAAEQMTAASFSPGLKERDPALFERYKRDKAGQRPARLRPRLGRRHAGAAAGREPALLPGPDNRRRARRLHVAWRWRGRRRRRLPAAAWSCLPTGHTAALEAPQEFNRIVLDFLAGVDARERSRRDAARRS